VETNGESAIDGFLESSSVYLGHPVYATDIFGICRYLEYSRYLGGVLQCEIDGYPRLLSVNIDGSSINMQDGNRILALEANLADLIIIDQRRLRITSYTDRDWFPLRYIPAQENNHALIKQREQQYLEGQHPPAFLTELGQQLLGHHQWGTEKQ